MGKRRRYASYDDEFRAGALVMLESQGYPDVTGALTAVAKKLSVPLSTLYGWWTAEHNPVPSKVRTLKKAEIIDIVRDEIYNALEGLDDPRAFASYRDRVTGAAILIDKLQLLEGKPTERSEQTINAYLNVDQELSGLPDDDLVDIVRAGPEATRN